MRRLALDTSTPWISVAVVDDDEVVAQEGVLADRLQGELLAPLVQRIAAQAGGDAGVEQVVVGMGPGPFTGLRVGIATARTLALAWDVPVLGLCSLDGMVGEGAVAIDARRSEVYWAEYREGARVSGPDVGRPEEVAIALAQAGVRSIAGIGGEHPAFDGFERVEPRFPTATSLARAARSAVPVDSPLYLRAPDAVARA